MSSLTLRYYPFTLAFLSLQREQRRGQFSRSLRVRFSRRRTRRLIRSMFLK